MTPVVALSIAGSDSGGGAGTQADLKTFAAHGVFGTSAVTALTAQNTASVAGVHVTPPEFLDRQIEAVLSDFDVQAVKTGMLATAANVNVVARRAAAGALPNLVVDPVLVASTGRPLLERDAERAYVEQLFPSAVVITPNLREAGRLLGSTLSTVDDMGAAARQLHAMGPRFVVVKGGHLGDDSDAVDVLFDGDKVILLRAPRIASANTHGTGCTFASALAAHLALGAPVPVAAERAKTYVTTAIVGSAAWRLGKGHGPLDHFGWGD